MVLDKDNTITLPYDVEYPEGMEVNSATTFDNDTNSYIEGRCVLEDDIPASITSLKLVGIHVRYS